MNPIKKNTGNLEDAKINVRKKLSALWTALMFCYIYNDFFGLYKPGNLEEILAGKMGPFPVTQAALISATILMAIPAVMIVLSLIVKPKIIRIVNIVLAVLYISVAIYDMMNEWTFYIIMVIIEILLLLSIIWTAVKWPKQNV